MWAGLRPQGAVTWFLSGGVRVCWTGERYAKFPLKFFLLCHHLFIPVRRNHFRLFLVTGLRGDGTQRVLGGWLFVCEQGRVAAARQRSSSSPVRGSVPQTLMEVSQAAVEESGRRPDVGFQSRVAAVSFPAVPGTRLTLPGVMDDEGRVDESRLRMHIFKNGRTAFFSAPTKFQLELG